MDFEFSPREQDFLREVDQFLKEHHDPKVMDAAHRVVWMEDGLVQRDERK